MNQDEFRRLAMLEIDAVYRLACHLSGRPDRADDLVQETYLRAFKSTTDFTLTEHGLRPYLFKILHNAVHTRFATERRQPAGVEDIEAFAGPAGADPDERCSDLGELNWDAVDGRLKRAIEELPLPHRTVFLLCAVEGLRYREIADVMDVPVGTVMSRLHRARQVLASQLTDVAAEQGLGRGKHASNGKNSARVDRSEAREGLPL